MINLKKHALAKAGNGQMNEMLEFLTSALGGKQYPLGDTGFPKKPLQVRYADLLDAIAQVDPTTLINRKYFTPYNPELLVSRKGLKVFDAMKRDDQVKACLKFKKDTMLSSGWEVVSPGDRDNDWEVTRFVRDQLNAVRGGWRKNAKKILTALDYGYSVTEKVFKELEDGDWKGKVGLDRLISIKPHYIDFVTSPHGELLAILQRNVINPDKTQKRDPVYPPGKFVVYTHAEEFENQYGVSDLVATYTPWWVKNNADKWLSIYLERFGMPPLIAMYNYGAYQGNMLDRLKDFLKTIQNSTVGVIPRLSKEDLELWSKEIGTNSKEIFVSSIEFYDRRIARSLLVPSLLGITSDEKQGSFARSQTHFDVYMLVIGDLQDDVAVNAVQDQLIKPLVDLNFPGLDEYPIYRSSPFNDPQLLEILKVWQELVKGKVINRVEDDETHIRKALKMPENEEPTLEPLPEDADRESSEKVAGERAKQAKQAGIGKKPVPKKKLNKKQKKFADDFDGTWYDIEGEMVCLSNQEEDEWDRETLE